MNMVVLVLFLLLNGKCSLLFYYAMVVLTSKGLSTSKHEMVGCKRQKV